MVFNTIFQKYDRPGRSAETVSFVVLNETETSFRANGGVDEVPR